ncbi:MAG: rfbD [Bacteroidetes bacterium]|nr:rfbD [Bacteroidota bacterium]
MKKILVTGGNGQLGSSLKSLSKFNANFKLIFTDVQELDITSEEKVSEFLDKDKYYAIINCAAYTAVDKAESDKDLACLLNTQAPKFLSIQASKRGIKLIHISTDYVFDGKKNTPLKPSDNTLPNSIYGLTKLEGEKNIIKYCSSGFIIIRTSWLYSEFGNNFLNTMLRLGSEKETLNVVYDQVGTPTFARDLAKTIITSLEHIQEDTKRIFHFSNEGVCSWYDFARKIMSLSKLDCKINPILSTQYPTPAPRPSYSVLDKTDIKEFLNIEIPYWEDALIECIETIRVLKSKSR